jgi:hypothetical protein
MPLLLPTARRPSLSSCCRSDLREATTARCMQQQQQQLKAKTLSPFECLCLSLTALQHKAEQVDDGLNYTLLLVLHCVRRVAHDRPCAQHL